MCPQERMRSVLGQDKWVTGSSPLGCVTGKSRVEEMKSEPR